MNKYWKKIKKKQQKNHQEREQRDMGPGEHIKTGLGEPKIEAGQGTGDDDNEAQAIALPEILFII
ncbi:Uncharacterised protein [Mycobacteroides abscessus subsp. abscessus]|nr:Uncharacterised protein [Mycobacteroides abscessus subsp. abscessus]